ncbi:MAG: DMT family transporter [Caldilineae bacterium]|nr:MAG: DMT family transporter [Caldilineae bacterium]
MRSAAVLSSSGRGLLYAGIAVLFFATSPVFIRWAGTLSSYEITFWRLFIATLALALAMRTVGESGRAALAEWRKFTLFGLVTALHFVLYVASLSFTTIAHTLSLLYTAPVFVTLFSARFLKEAIPRRKWGGILLATVGIGILAGFQPRFTGRMMVGDLLALGSAIMYALYSVIGRWQRTQYSLFSYATFVYGTAAIWAAIPAALAFTPTGYTPLAVLSLLGLGLLPLALGHTLYNAALRRTHATYVNIIATQEVTGGILLGVLLLGEVPGPNEIFGVVVTLLGVFLVIL